MHITSTANPRIKELRKLSKRKTRHARGQLLIEGLRLVRDVLKASRERNRHMLSQLSEDDRCELMRLMEKVTVGSLAYLRELKSEGKRHRPPPPATIFETEIL